MTNTKPPSLGRYLPKILFVIGYLTIILICLSITQVSSQGRYIQFGIFLLIVSVLIIVSYSIALLDSWLNPLQFQQSESESAKMRAAKYKYLRPITITNGKILLWWWRLISPLVVALGILLFKRSLSFL